MHAFIERSTHKEDELGKEPSEIGLLKKARVEPVEVGNLEWVAVIVSL